MTVGPAVLMMMLISMDVFETNAATNIIVCCSLNGIPSQCSTSCFDIIQSSGKNHQGLFNTCPPTMDEFWNCLRPFVSEFPSSSLLFHPSSSSSSSSSSPSSSSSSSDWWGRSCCELSLTSYCKTACLKAKSDHEMESHCSRADGSAVYKCLDKHREGQRCCKPSTTDQCHSSCKALFIQDTPPDLPQIQSAISQCNAPVVECILKSFPTSPSNPPARNIECCDHGVNQSCSKKCRDVLTRDISEEQMVELVTDACGIPNPGDPLWQCFLRSSIESKNRGGSTSVDAVGGMDAVKLQCCQRAQRNKCKELCGKTFGRGWSESISDFHQHCTNNIQEMSLNTCLDEAEDRCQLGCSNLTYCSNFNYRPTELFRKCGPGPDQEASKTFRSWRDGFISLPSILNFDIPVKDVTKCYPEKWQVIACALHIKPCRSGGVSWICKRDCQDILASCLDRKRMTVSMTNKEICEMLSPTDNPDECISVTQYLTEGHHKKTHQDVTTPCNPNPCNSKEVCLINRRFCRYLGFRQRPRERGMYSLQNNRNNEKQKMYSFYSSNRDDDAAVPSEYRSECPTYFCKPGCPMGEMVTQLVIPGSLLRLPDPTNQDCTKLCRCGYYGNWENCTKTCNEDGRQCLHSSGLINEHGTIFPMGCNTCVCNNREVICTKKFCRVLSFQPAPPYVNYVVPPALLVGGLPCNCSAHYKPVCATNGQTFPNFCLARCHKFELFQLQTGSCQTVDHCSKVSCPVGERCIKTPQVCFGGPQLPQNLCPQHQCVKLSTCNQKSTSLPTSSYCDVTTSREYSSLCDAVAANSTSVCSRYCSVGCKQHERVCGVDGVTYSSECTARCNNVPVDYYSHCTAVAQYHNVTYKTTCSRVNCPRSTVPGCIPKTPPGSCCPVCAGEIRCLVNQQQAIAMSHHHGSITISGLVELLETLLSVKECTIFAYFSMEDELVLLVAPTAQIASAVQVEACLRETSHLANLIASRSPTITSYAYTSILLTAELRNPKRTFKYYSTLSSASPSAILILLTAIATAVMRFRFTRSAMTSVLS